MEALKYKPIGFWLLDSTSPFTDYSGYSRTGTQAGTQVKGVALTNDAAYSQVVSSSNIITLGSTVYQNAGNNALPFSLGVTILPSTGVAASEQQLLSKDGQYDGLTRNGTTIYFETQYASNGVATCSYDLVTNQKADIIGVHTEAKNSLYVNGVLVAEVDITAAQQADVFITASSNNMKIGNSTSGQKTLVNNAMIFNSALTETEILAIYESNRRATVSDVGKSFAGESFNFSTEYRVPSIDTGFYTEDEWATGIMTECSADGDQLTPSLTGGFTSAGTWLNSVNLRAGETVVSYSALYLDWDSSNATVQYSTDSTTWTTATKKAPITGISDSIFLKVTFTAGQSFAYVENLRLFGYTAATASMNGRTVTYTAAMSMLNEHTHLELSDDWGVALNGATLTLAADAALEPRVIEVWVKQGTGTTLAKSFTASATYTNGIVVGSNPPVGEWAVMHYRTTSQPYTGSITLSGDVRIGRVVIYPADVSGSVVNITKMYTGVPKATATHTNTFQVSETGSPATVYAHDWQIVAS